MPNACRIRAERREDAGWKAPGHETHALEYSSPGEVELDVILEDDVNHREAERGLRAHDTDARESLQLVVSGNVTWSSTSCGLCPAQS